MALPASNGLSRLADEGVLWALGIGVTYTISGVPHYKYSILGPKPYSNHYGGSVFSGKGSGAVATANSLRYRAFLDN